MEMEIIIGAALLVVLAVAAYLLTKKPKKKKAPAPDKVAPPFQGQAPKPGRTVDRNPPGPDGGGFTGGFGG